MGEKINIAYLIYGLKCGGAEKLLVSIGKRINKDKFNVLVLALTCGGPIEEELIKENIKVKVLRRDGKFSILDFIRVLKLLKKENINLIHTHLTMADIVGGIISRTLRIKQVSTYHRVFNPYNWFELFKQKIGLKFAHKIICVSKANVYDCMMRFNIKKEKILLLYNGVDIERFKIKINPEIKKKELGIPLDCFAIAIISRLEPEKGHFYLFEAFCRILKKYKEIFLLVVGEGSLKEELIKFTFKLKIEKNVKFIGERKDIPEILQAIDLLVLPSLIEGFPLVILEALASGKPVIATSVGGVPEIIEDNSTGILIPPQDIDSLEKAISFVLDNPKEIKDMIQRGKDLVEKKFNIENMVRELEKLYESML